MSEQQQILTLLSQGFEQMRDEIGSSLADLKTRVQVLDHRMQRVSVVVDGGENKDPISERVTRNEVQIEISVRKLEQKNEQLEKEIDSLKSKRWQLWTIIFGWILSLIATAAFMLVKG